MPGETVLDKLVTVLAFNTDLAGLRRFDDKVRNTRKRLDGLSSAGFNIGRQLTVAGGIATGAFGLAAKQAIQWETDFTGVRKTVNATEEEFAALESRLRQMARDEVPLPAGELAALAEAAGQLDIETDNIDGFVKVIAQLGTTTNLAAEEGATQLARFANITGMAQSDFDRLGSAVVDLGNNFATTESEITAMALRLSGEGARIGLTQAQILGVATGLTSVGVNAEAGGTAFSRVFAEMDKAIKGGGDELEAFGKVVGKSGGEFAGTFTLEGPDVAIVEFIQGLQRINENGENVHVVLEELGFDTVRIRDSLLRSAGAGDLMAGAIAMGTKAWDENIALTREAELRYGTMASRFQFAKNRANDLAITVGGVLAPIITDLVDRLEPLIARVSEFAEAHPEAVKWAAALALVVTGLGVAVIAFAVVAKAASIILGGLTAVMAVARAAVFLYRNALLVTRAQLLLLNAQMIIARTVRVAMAVATGVATAAQWALNVAMTANPIGLIIVGIAALIAILAAVSFAVWYFRDEILGGLGGVWNWVKENWQTLGLLLLGPFGWAVLAIVKFGPQMFEAGKGFLQSFIDGFLSVKDDLIGAVTGALDEARDLLPFSDAKRGPLADLTASGRAIVDTLSAGIRQAGDIGLPLANALLPVGPAPQAAGAGGGGPTQLTITIDRIEIIANGGDPEQIAAGVEDALARQVRALVEEADTRVRV